MRLILALGLVVFSHSAWAACTDPAGMEGQMLYNQAWKVMQFCNGTDWKSMDASQAGGGGASTPAGAVMAFDLNTCPSGWSEYLPARGRFLRGIDSSGTIDPGGTRAPGHIQSQMFKQHGHTNYYASAYGQYGTMGAGWQSNFAGALGSSTANTISNHEYVTDSLDSTAGVETRPVNAAVMYCRKN